LDRSALVGARQRWWAMIQVVLQLGATWDGPPHQVENLPPMSSRGCS